MEKEHEESKTKAIDQPARGTKKPSPGEDGTSLAKLGTGPDPEIQASLEVVQESFLWLNDAAQQEVETLRRDIHKSDEPPWIERLAEGVLLHALSAGAAGIGVYVASKLVSGGEPIREFVKVLFEEGVVAGVDAGREKLANNPSDPDVADAFLDSQKEGIRATQIENQTRFIMGERDKISTLEDARSLKEACSRANIKQAAKKQSAATRDAWLSYLAQAQFGSTAAGTTNMMSQENREKANKSAPGFMPSHAPDRTAVGRSDAHGVLAVAVELPAIVGNYMDGKPKVANAVLNNVNQALREQYQGHALSEMNIPRLIVARVDGHHPDFEINIDEAGHPNYIDRHQGAWLAARTFVSPEHLKGDEYENRMEGLKLLLQEIVPTKINKHAGLMG